MTFVYLSESVYRPRDSVNPLRLLGKLEESPEKARLTEFFLFAVICERKRVQLRLLHVLFIQIFRHISDDLLWETNRDERAARGNEKATKKHSNLILQKQTIIDDMETPSFKDGYL